MHSSVELTQKLIRFNTVNPPGAERPCAEHLARLLAGAGFAVELVPFGEGRAQLLARIGGAPDKLPLGFTGHLDTVPLGARPWSSGPFEAKITDGKLYGRGSSDMKSDVAAFVTACIAHADRLASSPGVSLVITAGEETGYSGAEALVRANVGLDHVGALVVAEPTGDKPLVGHKGALWLEAETKGVTAHGSMPEKGINAIYKAARAVVSLQKFDFNVARHDVLGAPTLSVGSDMQARLFTLAPGDEIPWHSHSECADHYFVLEGILTVITRKLKREKIVRVGGRYQIATRIPHLMSNRSDADCRFLLLQGVGKCDWTKAGS